MSPIILKPQEGPQERFLATSADICIFGGSAGGGKSFALLLEPLRYMDVEGYKAVVFRQNYTQIMAAGGLWDESSKMPPCHQRHTGRLVEKRLSTLITSQEMTMFTNGKAHKFARFVAK